MRRTSCAHGVRAASPNLGHPSRPLGDSSHAARRPRPCTPRGIRPGVLGFRAFRALGSPTYPADVAPHVTDAIRRFTGYRPPRDRARRRCRSARRAGPSPTSAPGPGLDPSGRAGRNRSSAMDVARDTDRAAAASRPATARSRRQGCDASCVPFATRPRKKGRGTSPPAGMLGGFPALRSGERGQRSRGAARAESPASCQADTDRAALRIAKTSLRRIIAFGSYAGACPRSVGSSAEAPT